MGLPADAKARLAALTATGAAFIWLALLAVSHSTSARGDLYEAQPLVHQQHQHPDSGDAQYARALQQLAVTWKPKASAALYSPEAVDWAGVISACRAVGNYEKRLLSFILRTAFHDALGLNTTTCPFGSNKTCVGGADASVFTARELASAQNAGFAAEVRRAITPIAQRYNTSLADALQVCGAVAIEELSGGRVRIIGRRGRKNFRVGRLDAVTPAAPAMLPPSNQTVPAFADFWLRLGFSLREGVALLGSHALIKNHFCATIKGLTDCDPTLAVCSNIQMYTWNNNYYRDLCSASISFAPTNTTPIRLMTDSQFAQRQKDFLCTFTSQDFRSQVVSDMAKIRVGIKPQLADVSKDIRWTNTGCAAGAALGVVPANCPHRTRWPYTRNDAELGLVCQGRNVLNTRDVRIRDAMRSFLNQSTWDAVIPGAYIKMSNKGASFKNNATRQPILINGRECPKGYIMDTACAAANKLVQPSAAALCAGCTTFGTCNRCCRCSTAFKAGAVLTPPAGTTTPFTMI